MSGPVVWSLVVLVLAVAYAVECAIWPNTACRRCQGRGRFTSPITRSWRSCRKCDGSGRRARAGRALFGLLARK